jgi:hypothetical protein
VKRSQSRDFLQVDLQLDSSKNRKEVKFHKDIVESSRQKKKILLLRIFRVKKNNGHLFILTKNKKILKEKPSNYRISLSIVIKLAFLEKRKIL